MPRVAVPGRPETGPDPAGSPPPRIEGVAGGSARREYERRKRNDEQRLRQRWGRLGGIAVVLAGEQPSTRAWRIGAVGEEKLGAELGRRFAADGYILHDRRMPRTRANIDHLVVLPQGVWVIDTKRYRGRPRLRVSGGILRPETRTLTVAGRDQTRLVEGMHKQLRRVREAVGEHVPVTGALCFVDADWPLVGGPLRLDDQVWAVRPKKLYRMMAKGHPVIDIDAVRADLVRCFPSNDEPAR